MTKARAFAHWRLPVERAGGTAPPDLSDLFRVQPFTFKKKGNPMGFYTATNSWRRILSNASAMLLSSTGKVRVFIGSQAPGNDWDVGVILRGPSDLQVWDVATEGGKVWIKGEGDVRVLADKAAQMASPDQPGDDDTPPPPPPPEDDDDDTITPPPPRPGDVPKVIFSTDAAGDVDDLLAMGEVFTAHRKGKIQIIALMASASTAIRRRSCAWLPISLASPMCRWALTRGRAPCRVRTPITKS